ncbi:MAG: outer membrane protein, partial [Hyphomicrobiaceae bacterium]
MVKMSVVPIVVSVFALGGFGVEAADFGAPSDGSWKDPPATSSETWSTATIQKNPFSGLYIGAFGGIGGASFDGVHDSNQMRSRPREYLDTDLRSAEIYGGYLGYNLLRNGWLFGVDADFGGGGNLKSAGRDDEQSNHSNDGLDLIAHEIDQFGSLRTRAGVVWQNNTLLYGTAGAGYVG